MMLSGFHNGKSVGACLTAFYCEPACADIGVFYVGGFYLTAIGDYQKKILYIIEEIFKNW